MKVLLFILFGLIINLSVKAQLHTFDSLTLYKNNFSKPGKKITPYHQYNFNSIPSPINESSVLKIAEPVLTYKDNKNSFNIYQSSPDNMYLIRPDSTVAFNMPVNKSFIQTGPNK